MENADPEDAILVHYSDRSPVLWTHEGVDIRANGSGRFMAEIDGSDLAADTLEDLKDKIHSRFKAKARKKKSKVSVPVFMIIMDRAMRGGAAEAGYGTFRGVSAKMGEWLVTLRGQNLTVSDGSMAMWPTAGFDAVTAQEIVTRSNDAAEESRKAEKALRELTETAAAQATYFSNSRSNVEEAIEAQNKILAGLGVKEE